MVTIERQWQSGPKEWSIAYSSSIPGATYYVYVNGAFWKATWDTVVRVTVEAFQRVQVDVFDDPGDRPASMFPGQAVIQWMQGEAGTRYGVEEYVEGEWVARRMLGALAEGGVHTFNSRWLEDVTTHRFRVRSVSSDGVYGDDVEYSVFIVRVPDDPGAVVELIEETGQLRITVGEVEHVTTWTVTAGHTYKIVVRQQNEYGLVSLNSEGTIVVVDGEGAEWFEPPSGPGLVEVGNTGAGLATVVGQYYPAQDARMGRATVWRIWLTVDGSVPDGSGTPSVEQGMMGRGGVEYVRWTDDVALLDGTPLQVLVRTGRLEVVSVEGVTADEAQLPASGAGTIAADVLTGSFAGWPAAGYARVKMLGDVIRETVWYSSRTDQVLTVGAAGRGLLGTTASAGEETDVVEAVALIESVNTDVTTGEVNLSSLEASEGRLFIGHVAGQQQGVDEPAPETVYVDEERNIRFELDSGSAAFYADMVLIWRCIFNSMLEDQCVLYVPSEWGMTPGDLSGAAADTWEIEAWNGSRSFWLNHGAAHVMKFDVSGLVLTRGYLQTHQTLPDRHVSEAWRVRYGDVMFFVRDGGTWKWEPYLLVNSSGEMRVRENIVRTLTQAEIEAL